MSFKISYTHVAHIDLACVFFVAVLLSPYGARSDTAMICECKCCKCNVVINVVNTCKKSIKLVVPSVQRLQRPVCLLNLIANVKHIFTHAILFWLHAIVDWFVFLERFRYHRKIHRLHYRDSNNRTGHSFQMGSLIGSIYSQSDEMSWDWLAH